MIWLVHTGGSKALAPCQALLCNPHFSAWLTCPCNVSFVWQQSGKISTSNVDRLRVQLQLLWDWTPANSNICILPVVRTSFYIPRLFGCELPSFGVIGCIDVCLACIKWHCWSDDLMRWSVLIWHMICSSGESHRSQKNCPNFPTPCERAKYTVWAYTEVRRTASQVVGHRSIPKDHHLI